MSWRSRGLTVLGSLDYRRQLLKRRSSAARAVPRQTVGRGELMLGAVVSMPHRDERRRAVAKTVDRLPPVSSSGRRVVQLVLDGSGGGHQVADPGSAPGVEVASARGDLVCITTRDIEPLDPRWLDRLAVPIGGEVTAATPVVLHPERPAVHATSHDLRVRERGLCLALDRGGEPFLEAVGAGSSPESGRDASASVDAASSCLLVDRAAYERVGGLGSASDAHTQIADLAWRLRSSGGTVVSVPDAFVVDRSSVAAPVNLHRPLAPPAAGWRDLVDRYGPSFRHAATGHVRPRIAITTAAPPGLVARRWGDWELASGLARSLGQAGVAARVQTHDQAEDLASRTSDVQLVLRGLLPVRRTSGQRHVLWVISHPDDLARPELDEADLVLACSRRLAEHFRGITDTPVEVLLQGTDHRRFRPVPVRAAYAHPITVVANTRGVFRPAVAFAVETGLRPAIYGDGWGQFVDRSLIVQRHIANDEMPVVYSSASVVLNDHWPEMARWGMVSNRVYDVLACGTPIISDHVSEIDEQFGKTVPMYDTAAELHDAVCAFQNDPEGAKRRAEEGRRIVLADHTLDRRASELIELLRSHDLLPGA